MVNFCLTFLKHKLGNALLFLGWEKKYVVIKAGKSEILDPPPVNIISSIVYRSLVLLLLV